MWLLRLNRSGLRSLYLCPMRHVLQRWDFVGQPQVYGTVNLLALPQCDAVANEPLVSQRQPRPGPDLVRPLGEGDAQQPLVAHRP